jgi:hypothetical protein
LHMIVTHAARAHDCHTRSTPIQHGVRALTNTNCLSPNAETCDAALDGSTAANHIKTQHKSSFKKKTHAAYSPLPTKSMNLR